MWPRSKSVSINAVGLGANNEEWPFKKVRAIIPNFVLQDAQLLIGRNAVKSDKVDEIAENTRTLDMAKELMS
jgi:hypothetical protein